MEKTSIQISLELKEELKKLKISNEETYEDVIWNILESNKELSDKTKKEIDLSKKEFEEGNYISLTKLKVKYGLKNKNKVIKKNIDNCEPELNPKFINKINNILKDGFKEYNSIEELGKHIKSI